MELICLGYSAADKDAVIMDFCSEHAIKNVVVLSPPQHFFKCSFEHQEFVKYSDIIMYRYFYRLLQEIDANTLVVVNECLQTKNRNDLTYNCIRNFLNQTDNQIVFNYLPIIESAKDFFTLFDFDTRSRWKRETDIGLLKNSDIHVLPVDISFNKTEVFTDLKTKNKYAEQKSKLIGNIGLKDPHTIPRNLYLLAGKSKLKVVSNNKHYVGRNNRFKLSNLVKYKDNVQEGDYTVFEFCHNFIDFVNFMAHAKYTDIDVLVSDLKVDEWYFERYCNWVDELGRVYAEIR